MEEVKKVALGTVRPDLKTLFDKSYDNYIKEGSEYWWAFGRGEDPVRELSMEDFEAYKEKYPERARVGVTWFKITITYIRTGIVFYRLSDFSYPNESLFSLGSIMAERLVPAVINRKEFEDFWEQHHKIKVTDYEFDTMDNSVTIEVV